jgi:hypothetical protein
VSIIYEALKKTQLNREVKRNPVRKVNRNHFKMRMRINIRDFDWPDVALAGVIGVLLVTSVSVYSIHFAHKFSHHTLVASNTHHTAAPVAKAGLHQPVANAAQVALPPETVITGTDNTDLVLNGVLLSDEEKLALINNKTFHVGDMVGGMRIVSIDFNSVKLASGGQLMTLRTSS